MESRVFNRKNLLGFSMIVLFYHLAMTIIPWFIYSWPMFIADYILLGLTSAGWLLYFGWQRRTIRLQPAILILLGFLIWLLVSCIVMTIRWDNDWVGYNFIPTIASPTSPGFNAAVTILFVFPLGIALARETDGTVLKLGKGLLHGFLLGWTVWMAVVLITVMQGKTMTAPSGGTIGMVNSNLELNCHYNITGSWEMTFFMVCCFMALKCKGIPWKGVYGLAAVIHYFALILSNSRASTFAALGGFAVLAGVAVFLVLEKRKVPRSVLLALAAAVIAAVGFYFMRYPVFSLYGASVNHFTAPAVSVAADAGNASGADSGADASTAADAGNAGVSSGASSGQDYRIREFAPSSGSLLSGREEIWKYTVQGLFADPQVTITGVTPKATRDLFMQASEGRRTDSYTHNEFLEIAAAMGLPGLLLFLVWLGIIVRDTWRMYFTRKRRTLLLILPVIFVTLLAANMMEAHLIFCEHLNGYVFFLLGGMIYGAMSQRKRYE